MDQTIAIILVIVLGAFVAMHIVHRRSRGIESIFRDMTAERSAAASEVSMTKTDLEDEDIPTGA